MNLPRAEYPRPQFVREQWVNLNGTWQFSFDSPVFDREITVPFAYQSKLSGIGLTERHDKVWYRRRFDLPPQWQSKRTLLHFGAVDYACRVWVNDCFVGSHTGGHVCFSLDVTEALQPGGNTVTVEVTDVLSDLTVPRGKQYWQTEPKSIYYTATTGIWQTVWLECVDKAHICQVDITPDLDKRTVSFAYTLSECGLDLEITVSFQGRPVAAERTKALGQSGAVVLTLEKERLGVDDFTAECAWCPERPWLFDVTYRLFRGDVCVDQAASYFGMRKISVENGVICLNNAPYYQKLLLDQGYWPDSLLTAPSDEAFVSDIRHCKAMGFNGVRKHQKVEDPRFLYHADRMGLLVWGEMANAFSFSPQYVCRMTQEWMEVLRRDYNHPCIVVWTPVNESWGVEQIGTDTRQTHHSSAMAELTRSLDATRLVLSNDGWQHTDSDILGIHDYDADPALLEQRYASIDTALRFRPAGRPLFAGGFAYKGQPVMITECGGIACRADTAGWGYSSTDSEEAFLLAYGRVISTILASPLVQGFCYTQLTDVQQEQNGLLTFGHTPKFDCGAIRKINEGK